jgi:hypothetical protein
MIHLNTVRKRFFVPTRVNSRGRWVAGYSVYLYALCRLPDGEIVWRRGGQEPPVTRAQWAQRHSDGEIVRSIPGEFVPLSDDDFSRLLHDHWTPRELDWRPRDAIPEDYYAG